MRKMRLRRNNPKPLPFPAVFKESEKIRVDLDARFY